MFRASRSKRRCHNSFALGNSRERMETAEKRRQMEKKVFFPIRLLPGCSAAFYFIFLFSVSVVIVAFGQNIMDSNY